MDNKGNVNQSRSFMAESFILLKKKTENKKEEGSPNSIVTIKEIKG